MEKLRVGLGILALVTSGCGSDSGGGGARRPGPDGGPVGASGFAGSPFGTGGGVVGAGGEPIGTGGGIVGAGGFGAGGLGGGGAPLGTGGSTVPPGSDNTTKTGGVGKPCEVDTDCPTGLVCHQDASTYIGYKQCTTACAADTDCTSRFGQYSMCIGANICVTKCIVDSDCPAKTKCISAGWCERTGPGSGVPYCAGSVLPCAGLPDSECISTLGCTSGGGTCGGVPDDCYAQFDSFSCDGIQGCFWDSSLQSCSGSAEPCDLMPGQASCTYQTGCYWTPGSCTGVPETCDQIPVAVCTLQAGCVVSQ